MTDPQTLFSQAQCYVCLGISISEALQIALLAQIASGGGTGTGGNNNLTTSDANPNTAGLVPPDQTKASWFYQDPASGSGTNVWTWSVTNKNWTQFSA